MLGWRSPGTVASGNWALSPPALRKWILLTTGEFLGVNPKTQMTSQPGLTSWMKPSEILNRRSGEAVPHSWSTETAITNVVVENRYICVILLHSCREQRHRYSLIYSSGNNHVLRKYSLFKFYLKENFNKPWYK